MPKRVSRGNTAIRKIFRRVTEELLSEQKELLDKINGDLARGCFFGGFFGIAVGVWIHSMKLEEFWMVLIAYFGAGMFIYIVGRSAEQWHGD